ncbi:MAG: AMIN domain-containing protein, partial [Sinobacteraceae bacterium]|nr:AMIN domain-containing protein [Nevskiaceae bacterium]
MKRKAFEIGGVLALALWLTPALGTEAELRGARLIATPNSAQLTLDLAGAATEHVFSLQHPHRTVIDLPHTRMARGFRMPAVGTGIVTDIRVGHQLARTVRIVMQLREKVEARSVWAASG